MSCIYDPGYWIKVGASSKIRRGQEFFICFCVIFDHYGRGFISERGAEGRTLSMLGFGPYFVISYDSKYSVV